MLVLGKDKLFIYLPLFDFNNESFEKSIENSNNTMLKIPMIYYYSNQIGFVQKIVC